MTPFNIIVTFIAIYVALLSVVIHHYQQASALMSAAVDVDTKAALATAANEARGLAMDSIAAAHSGHMGLPLGAAEIGATLYGLEVSCRFPTIFLATFRLRRTNFRLFLAFIDDLQPKGPKMDQPRSIHLVSWTWIHVPLLLVEPCRI